ncbi:hypothetical protein H4582DRAFT_2053991 [Lactarius indigo]|nr:hypothetical protein H4582DRAFT_2053991 [Lactarius indigo]
MTWSLNRDTRDHDMRYSNTMSLGLDDNKGHLWQASHAVGGIKDNGPRDFKEKEIDLMSREQKRTEAQECGHDIKIQNNEQRWPVLGIIRMNVIWTTKVGDRPENKQHAWDAPTGAKGIVTQLAAAAPLQWHKSVAA